MKNLLAFTMAGGGQAAPIFGLMPRRIAFTMAEILLSLTIIGVVAAITLPSLTGNINERTWNTQRKALYSRMSQAVSLMPSLNAFGSYIANEDDPRGETSIGIDNTAETFLSAGLSKVLKINNICDNEHLTDCGLPDAFINMKSSKIKLNDIKTLKDYNSTAVGYNSAPDGTYAGTGYSLKNNVNTKAAAFETANGESVLLYYNPRCISGEFNINQRYNDGTIASWLPAEKICANMIYDLNGKKGPNTMGKDVGILTVFFPTDSIVVSPVPHNENSNPDDYSYPVGVSRCKIYKEDSRVPNVYEMSAISFNYNLTAPQKANSWTSTLITDDTNKKYRLIVNSSPSVFVYAIEDNKNAYSGLRCVER